MKQKMHRRFIAGVSALAILITGVSAAPGRADDDFLKTLAIVAGVAIVGKVIYDQTRGNRERAATRPAPAPRAAPRQNAPTIVKTSLRPRARTEQTSLSGVPEYDRSPLAGLEPRPLPARVAAAQLTLLPGDCLRSATGRAGNVQYFETACLAGNAVDVSRLPEDCAVDLGTRRASRSGFEARCLSQAGYRLAPT